MFRLHEGQIYQWKQRGGHLHFITIDIEKHVIILFGIMRIEYKDKRLQQCAKDPRAAKRFLGTLALSFLMRIELIDKATCFEDLRFMLGKFHELTGNRQGQWSASLNANYRLILTPKDKPFMDESGRIDWTKSTEAVIIEIADYH